VCGFRGGAPRDLGLGRDHGELCAVSRLCGAEIV
jgi:hypothetical protein